MSTHTDQMSKECENCDNKFQTELELEWHVETTHPALPEPLNSSHSETTKKDININYCSICIEVFPTLFDLEWHK